MRPFQPIALLLPFLLACGTDSITPSDPIPTAIPEGLWTASANPGAVLRLAPDQLDGIGDRLAATAITTSSAPLFTPVGLAVDRDGTIWVASLADSLLLGFRPNVLAGSGSRAASVVIGPVAHSLSGPAGLAFDLGHRLWVANFNNGTVVRYDPTQLGSSGSPPPAVILTGLGHPTALAFDATGRLWVSDKIAQTVTAFPPAELLASGTPHSSVVLQRGVNGIVNPSGMAFDAAGNLWIANTGSHSLLSFTPAQLTTAGSPAPHVVLESNQGALSIPVGLAFDAEGSLWVINGGGELEKYRSQDLNSSGAPAPTARLVVAGHALFFGVAFFPRPAGLPIN